MEQQLTLPPSTSAASPPNDSSVTLSPSSQPPSSQPVSQELMMKVHTCQSRFNGAKDFVWQFSVQRLPNLLADREKMVTTSAAPTLTVARAAFGDAPVRLVLRSHLYNMAITMGVTSTPEAMDGIIEDVISGYGDLKVTEVILAFKMIREGKFRNGESNRGSFYGSLSSDVICDCLYKFRTDYRNPILARIEQNQKPKEEKPAATYEEYSQIIVNSILALRYEPEKMGRQFLFFKSRLKQEDMLQLEKYIEEQQKLLADLSQVKKQVADLEYMQRAIKTTASITDTARREACFVRLLELANQYDEKYAPLEPTKEQ